MKWLKVFCQILLFDVALVGAIGSTQAAEVELRVLVVAVGTTAVDPGRAVIEDLLNSVGVPYEVIDTSIETLTAAKLQNGARGRFNGIILTDAETYLPGVGGYGLGPTGFQLLHQYERNFGVREAVISGYPAWDASVDLDYGMDLTTITGTSLINGRWQSPAGGTQLFEYINTANLLPTVDLNNVGAWTVTAVPRNDGSGPTVVPLLVDELNPTKTVISELTYLDGRKVLLCTMSNATWYLHSNVLAYEFLNYATSGLFIGARHVYLEAHSDDLFIADDVWNPATNINWPEDGIHAPYRLGALEFIKLAAAMTTFWKQHPLARSVTIDHAFNGIGTSSKDPLTTAVRLYGLNFGFINHTYSHADMGGCFDVPQKPCTLTPYSTVYNEINKNATVWKNLRLPGYQYASSELLTGEYSGLSDPGDGLSFSAGFNPALGKASSALGVRMLASDSSLPNQNIIQQVVSKGITYNIVLMPRYPTSIYYNANTPDQNVSEYNNMLYDSTCTDPSKNCKIFNYNDILNAEVNTTLQQMLSNNPFPHMFHQSNLHTYDSAGHIMLIDWLNAVLTKYEGLIKLPIVSPRFHDLNTLAWQILAAKKAAPSGFVNTTTGVVTLQGSSAATVEVTGLAGGTLYGGQKILKAAVSTTPKTYTYDPALTQ